EITIYRLRRPSNDRKLPAPERRRLEEIRALCKELDVVVRHIPSELNLADEVLKVSATSAVVYDYRESPIDDTESEDGCAVVSQTKGEEEKVDSSRHVMVVNEDGINLPDLEGFAGEEYEELAALM
ncbi:hypothetical protein FOZ62_020511, partial [Perkinsus olseni]